MKKYRERRKDLHMVFNDLGQAYDRVHIDYRVNLVGVEKERSFKRID